MAQRSEQLNANKTSLKLFPSKWDYFLYKCAMRILFE